jgi:hypothetical protein
LCNATGYIMPNPDQNDARNLHRVPLMVNKTNSF